MSGQRYKLCVHLSPMIYEKLPIVPADDPTREKLKFLYASVGGIPRQLYVQLPRKTLPENVPTAITSRYGKKCILYVKTTKYTFPSRMQKNKGERVTGITLTLDEICDVDLGTGEVENVLTLGI